MKKHALAFSAAIALAAVARGGSLLEVHLESKPNAETARAWVLRGTGRAEAVYLDLSVLFDQAAVSAADVESGPDGSPQIRLTLTSEGAERLREITTRNVGRRLGIVLDGQLRAAPVIVGPIGNGVLVVGAALAAAEAAALARKLGPPSTTSPTALAGVAAAPASDSAALRGLEGTWVVLGATMNGEPRSDRKLTRSTWTFRNSELLLTNEEGATARYTLSAEAGTPGAIHLDPAPPSLERGGWMLFARDGDLLTLAFGDNLEGRPDSLAPAPKRIILKLARKNPR